MRGLPQQGVSSSAPSAAARPMQRSLRGPGVPASAAAAAAAAAGATAAVVPRGLQPVLLQSHRGGGGGRPGRAVYGAGGEMAQGPAGQPRGSAARGQVQRQHPGLELEAGGVAQQGRAQCAMGHKTEDLRLHGRSAREACCCCCCKCRCSEIGAGRNGLCTR